MDEVVARSTALRARQLDTKPSVLLDDIPHLTRALEQIHQDSTRLLTARTASTHPSTAVHAPALRLFSTVGFPADRLRRAVHDLDTSSAFADSALRHTPPLRHPAWLSSRSLDDARLALNAALRTVVDAATQADLRAASRDLSAALPARTRALTFNPAHQAAAVGTPGVPMSTATPPSHRRGASTVTPLSSARRPRAATTPGSNGMGSTPGTISRATPGAPPPIAAGSLPWQYVEAVRGIATRGEAPSVAELMLETAIAARDSPHFIQALSVVATAARHVPPGRRPRSDMLVWAARTVLEDQVAARISGLPDTPRFAPPTAVVAPVEEYVKAALAGGQLRVTAWTIAFYCLRIGCVSAAVHALRARGRAAAAAHFQALQAGRREVRSSYATLLAEDNERDREKRGEDDNEMSNENNSVDEVDMYDLRRAPMSPGLLTKGEARESAAADLRAASCTSNDPFMKACYLLLMRLELRPAQTSGADVADVMGGGGGQGGLQLGLTDGEFNLLFGSVEDYFWFRLWLCTTPCERRVMEGMSDAIVVTPAQIQAHVLSLGPAHFDIDGGNPLMYGFVLSSTGLFEEAVDYLGQHAEEHWMHYSVHLALVLYHLHWLGDLRGFHALLGRYTSLVGKLSPATGALYILTLRERDVVERSLYDLIVNTNDYETLLGSGDGIAHGELSDMLTNAATKLPSGFDETALRKLRIEAAVHGAHEAAARRDYASAAALYALGERKGDGVEMRMHDLADEVDKESSTRRSLAVARARDAVGQIRNGVCDHNRVAAVARTLDELVNMATVFDHYWTGRLGAAWDSLRLVKSIPLRDTDVAPAARRVAADGDDVLGSVLRRPLGNVVEVAVRVAEIALRSGSFAKPNSAHEQQEWQEQQGQLHQREERPQQPQQPQEGLQAHLQSQQQAQSQTRRPQRGVPEVGEVRATCMFAAMLGVGDAASQERMVGIQAMLDAATRASSSL